MEKTKFDFKKTVSTYALLSIGALLVACGVYFFKFPNNFATGGVSGISVILGRVIENFSPGSTVFILNGILLVIGFLVLGKSFGIRTVYCSTLMSAAIWLLEIVFPMDAPFTHQPLLELIFSVILPAVGSAVLFNTKASTGGTDIVAMILKKYTNLDIGKSLLIVDVVIVIISAFVFGIETGMFSLLGLTIKALFIDTMIESINLSKYFMIITEKPEPICAYINKTLNRGATIWEAVGSYSQRKKYIVLVVLNRTQAAHLRAFISQEDPSSFILITNTSDIIGKGFRQTQ